jgi:TetR/AcrR family transcriptional regulator, transcriptional repressor for nem operon
MTDSDSNGHGSGAGVQVTRVPQKSDKRERLVQGACLVLHQQGVEKTSLADIAQAANVPVGNVYYYFKTKDELVQAAIDAHAQDIETALASLDRHRSPKARLKAFVRLLRGQRELAARYGCPQGTLCSELDKRDDGLGRAGAKLMQLSIDWAERQFRAMGRRDARDLAVALIAAYQGISLLTNTFREPELMARETRRLERWIDSLG